MAQITEGTHYKLGKWQAPHHEDPDNPGQIYNNYECMGCQFSTLYKDKMQEHYDTARGPKGHKHAWAFPVDQSTVTISETPIDARY